MDQPHLVELLHDVFAEARWIADRRTLLEVDFGRTGSEILAVLAGQPLPAGRNAATHRRRVQWIQQQWLAGARLTLGVPGCPADRLVNWLGPRLAWWPRGIPRGRRVGLVSSRLGRRLEKRGSWFHLLRLQCARLDRNRDLVLTAAETSSARFVERGAELYGLRRLHIERLRGSGQSLSSWLRWLPQACQNNPVVYCPGRFSVHLSPPLVGTAAGENETLARMPLQDRAIMVLSDRVFALHIRRYGFLHQLLKERLVDPAWPASSISFALSEDLVGRSIGDELLGQGAVGCLVPGDSAPSHPGVAIDERECGPRSRTPRVVPVPDATNWDYLTHWTRRQDGPWPDQCERDYLDDLILGRADADHTALASLLRIVRQRRIYASRCARGDVAVVSFTGVPLIELVGRRVFRRHRVRWDFETYGICIRRGWLQQRGARQVRYGDERLWQSLPADERPLFQPKSSRAARSGKTIDWTVEREWRHVGDIELHELRAEDGLLFVPSQPEAAFLAELSPWPVTVIGSG